MNADNYDSLAGSPSRAPADDASFADPGDADPGGSE
jgi:hypothetical protein